MINASALKARFLGIGPSIHRLHKIAATTGTTEQKKKTDQQVGTGEPTTTNTSPAAAPAAEPKTTSLADIAAASGEKVDDIVRHAATALAKGLKVNPTKTRREAVIDAFNAMTADGMSDDERKRVVELANMIANGEDTGPVVQNSTPEKPSEPTKPSEPAKAGPTAEDTDKLVTELTGILQNTIDKKARKKAVKAFRASHENISGDTMDAIVKRAKKARTNGESGDESDDDE